MLQEQPDARKNRPNPIYQQTGIINLYKDLISFIFAPSKQWVTPCFGIRLFITGFS
jgi:hypothetical protein